MNNSNSGIISTEFVNVSDSFSDYADISHNNHNRLVKAKRFGKWYMLKGLNAEYADKAVFVELLRKEFDLGISLDHPAIIRTIGKESDSNIGDCIVLEYIDGTTLGEWLKTTPSKNERRRVIVQLLDAMNYFHAKGVIHRDLKPDNILITRNGANVKVIDFGLSDSDEYAILKQPVGSRKYSAPEQFTGGAMVDLRADIYAFGVILQEFGLDGVYKSIARKATQNNAADRYDNAEQILSTIHNRRQVNTVATIVVVVLGLGLGIVGLLRSISTQQQPMQAQPLTTDTVVREVLRDTIVKIKEVPVVVEKVVLKDIGESDSAYVARKNWEKSIKQRITAKYKKLYTPIVERYRKAKTMADINLIQTDDSKMPSDISKFNTDMMSEVGADNESYPEIVLFLSCAGLSYTNEIAAIQKKVIENAHPSK